MNIRSFDLLRCRADTTQDDQWQKNKSSQINTFSYRLHVRSDRFAHPLLSFHERTSGNVYKTFGKNTANCDLPCRSIRTLRSPSPTISLRVLFTQQTVRLRSPNQLNYSFRASQTIDRFTAAADSSRFRNPVQGTTCSTTTRGIFPLMNQ